MFENDVKTKVIKCNQLNGLLLICNQLYFQSNPPLCKYIMVHEIIRIDRYSRESID